jgi:hypothetical protein
MEGKATGETLWPYRGFNVRAFEKRLGEGRLTLKGQSLLFEGKNGSSIGFDFSVLRLIRLLDVHNVELAFSVQGELRTLSLKVVCTFYDGSETEQLPSWDNPDRMSLFRAITGGVVARSLSDHTSAKTEGLTRMTDEKFELRMEDLQRNLELFPDKKQFEDDKWLDDELRKQTLEAAKSEVPTWGFQEDIPFDNDRTPCITVDMSFAKLGILLEDWVNGRISPLQRVRCVAMSYKIALRMYEKGYPDGRGGSADTWKKTAEKLVQFEKVLGLGIQDFA